VYEFKRYICVWNSKTLRYLSRKQVQTISRLKGLLDGGGDAGLLTSRGVVAIVVVAVSVVVGSSETGGSRNLAVGTYTGRALIIGVLVVTVLVLVDTSDLGLKVLQRNSGENGVLVNNRGIVDLLVDGDGGVNVGVLDGLPVDDRLDGLVDVVVDVLGGNSGGGNHVPVNIINNLAVGVKVSLLLELLSVLGKHVVFRLPRELRGHLVLVLCGQYLVVNNRLNPVLVVVNVPLPVNSLDLLDSLVSGDVLLDDGGGGLGADLGGVSLVGTGQESLDVVNDSSSGGSGGGVVVVVGSHFK